MFRIKERMSVNLRAEFTNIFNRTEMADPSPTAFSAAQTTLNGKTTGWHVTITPLPGIS
jgi:hypothetical protein